MLYVDQGCAGINCIMIHGITYSNQASIFANKIMQNPQTPQKVTKMYFKLMILSTVWKETHACSINHAHLVWQNYEFCHNAKLKSLLNKLNHVRTQYLQ